MHWSRNRPLIGLLAACLLVRLAVLLIWSDFTQLNPDEERNFTIASNHLAGLGYTLDGKLTAIHGSTTVFVYEWMIRAVSTSVRQPVSEFTVAPPRARSGKGPGRREAVAVCL